MKTFAILITTMLLSVSTFAQANDFEIKTINQFLTDSSVVDMEVDVEDTPPTIKSASLLKQFQNYALRNVKYPDDLIEHGFEGTIVVAISISPAGKIENMQVVKSFSSYFNDSVLDQLQGLKSLNILNKPYTGQPVVYLPIKFSLR